MVSAIMVSIAPATKIIGIICEQIPNVFFEISSTTITDLQILRGCSYTIKIKFVKMELYLTVEQYVCLRHCFVRYILR